MTAPGLARVLTHATRLSEGLVFAAIASFFLLSVDVLQPLLRMLHSQSRFGIRINCVYCLYYWPHVALVQSCVELGSGACARV